MELRILGCELALGFLFSVFGFFFGGIERVSRVAGWITIRRGREGEVWLGKGSDLDCGEADFAGLEIRLHFGIGLLFSKFFSLFLFSSFTESFLQQVVKEIQKTRSVGSSVARRLGKMLQCELVNRGQFDIIDLG